jgi:hypothetical protein
MSCQEDFNRSFLSRFLNSPTGRAFRVLAGIAFLIVGYLSRGHLLGWVAIIWSIFPLTAGGFDVCYISAALGGPLSGSTIRSRYGPPTRPAS